VTSVTIESYSYPIVSIGTQCWMAENLRVRKYSDGTYIRFDTSGSSGGKATGQTWTGTGLNYGAYTLYAHDSVATPSSNLLNYGYLYNWYAVVGIITHDASPTKKICPSGWHVPTDAEWTTLTTFLGGLTEAGGKMKSTSPLWNPNTGANNTSGFSALPGGYRPYSGSFDNVRTLAFFWSATTSGVNNAMSRSLYNDNGYVSGSAAGKITGGSVRCLRNTPI
jgi:uncharacterized protein (TIGR02145 family)